MKKLWQALLLVRGCDRWLFRRRVVYVVLQSVLPLVNLYVLKLLVDAVGMMAAGGGSEGYAWALNYLLLMVGVYFLRRVITALYGVNGDVLSQKIIDYMSDLMQRQSARLDMAYYDTPEYYDTLHRAQQEATARPLQIMNNFMSLFGELISIVGVVAMLCTASGWVIVVMAVAVAPSFAVRLVKARRVYRFRKANTQLYRQTAYYGTVLSARDYAKEMRAYGLADFFRKRFVGVRHQLVEKLLHISRQLGVMDMECAVVEAVAMFVVVWMLIGEARAEAITVGTFVMLFEAYRRGQGYMSGLVAAVATLYDNRLFVGNLFDFLEMQPTLCSPQRPLPVPDRVETVEFRNITFRYPGMDRMVLDHFSLIAKVGEITQIEGENGYGKSTLVKLLLRLYDPDEGAVLVNGIDIREFPIEAWRKRVGVLFQDFVCYHLTVAENISFADDSGVKDAAQLATADDFVEKLPEGYNNMLGRAFNGGAELSMGQWQRIAIARMIHTQAPILVMDEPMAWMDIPTRQRFLDKVEVLKKDRVIIMITHT
ncbi:MAG: ABC transporter ATP-binding protein [Bacteroidales bacterium]|nr:ABC transporter ATP-binding protein [Bacteroidales bacterium]